MIASAAVPSRIVSLHFRFAIDPEISQSVLVELETGLLTQEVVLLLVLGEREIEMITIRSCQTNKY